MKPSRIVPLFAWLLLLLFSLGLKAQAAEPTVQEIYQAASHGDLPGAQRMVDQVLQAHPGSATAHYIKAELATRGNDAATARTELQEAERLAPGLPFVRPEAASALRTQVDRMSATSGAAPMAQEQEDTRRMGAPPAMEAPEGTESRGGFSLGPLLLVALPIAALLMLRRRRRAASQGPAGYAPGAGSRGGAPFDPFGRGRAVAPDANFGRGDDMVYDRYGRAIHPAGDPGYGMDPRYAGRRAGGMGSAIAGGLGAGLAMGAGAVAAQEIGRRMMERGQDGQPAHDASGGDAADSQIARDAGLAGLDPSLNSDMGGQDFGLLGDTGWDDGGGFGDMGGDDWSN